MKFNAVFALVVCFFIGLSSCLPPKIESARNDIRRLVSQAKAHNANAKPLEVVPKDDEINLLPAFEALFSIIDLEAALELISMNSPCGAELFEYLRGNFSDVIDDFYAEPGIMSIFEYIAENGFEDVYQLIGIMHLLMGMKLPPFPYPTEGSPALVLKEVLADEEECTPEDQAKINELLARMIPIWKMLDIVLELMATDHSFVSFIIHVRGPATAAGWQTFYKKDSAVDLGRRMEATGVNPKIIIAVLNVFFGIENK